MCESGEKWLGVWRAEKRVFLSVFRIACRQFNLLYLRMYM